MQKIYIILILSILWFIQACATSSSNPCNKASSAPLGTSGIVHKEQHPAPVVSSCNEPNKSGGSKKGHGGPVIPSVTGSLVPDTNDFPEEDSFSSIADPFEPLNRASFHFNDKFYFWLMKPAATGYKAVFPQPIRVGVKNFFYNLAFPIRFVNCLLQAKFKGAIIEFSRFTVNTAAGMLGFVDAAKGHLEYEKYDEDFGQSLGYYGLGPGFFLNLPLLGPSSLRDAIGLAGDSFLDPVNYIVPRAKYNIPIKFYHGINKTSLTIGDYEDLKRSALDPYVSLRDAYYQYRQNKIRE